MYQGILIVYRSILDGVLDTTSMVQSAERGVHHAASERKRESESEREGESERARERERGDESVRERERARERAVHTSAALLS